MSRSPKEIVASFEYMGPEMIALLGEAAQHGREEAISTMTPSLDAKNNRIAELEAQAESRTQLKADNAALIEENLELRKRVTQAEAELAKARGELRADEPPEPPRVQCRYEHGFADGWRECWREAKSCPRDPGK